MERTKGNKPEEKSECLRPRPHWQQWPGIWAMQFHMNDSRTWKFIQNHTSELCFELKTSVRTLFPLASPGLMSLHEQQGFLSSCLLGFYSIGPNGKSLYPEKLWQKPKTAIWKCFTNIAHIWIDAETKKVRASRCKSSHDYEDTSQTLAMYCSENRTVLEAVSSFIENTALEKKPRKMFAC